jgi:HTH-type transcriptional regulator/antitoxin HigA
MTIAPIRTASEYKAALRELSRYFDNEPDLDSEAGRRFEQLIALVEAYEADHAA